MTLLHPRIYLVVDYMRQDLIFLELQQDLFSPIRKEKKCKNNEEKDKKKLPTFIEVVEFKDEDIGFELMSKKKKKCQSIKSE